MSNHFDLLIQKAQDKNLQTISGLALSTAQFFKQYCDLKGRKVMILFSGGLDTSFMAHFLQHIIQADVITFSANVGSVTTPVNMKEIAERSKELGISRHVEFDCRNYLSNLALNAINAEATLGMFGHHPASSLSRIAICESAVKYAKEHDIVALVHGSNGSQNNPYRFMSALQHFRKLYEYDIKELTPNLGKTTVAREAEALYLTAMGVGLKSKSFEKNISHDRNLLGDEWEEDFIANPANQYDVRATALRDIEIPSASKKLGIRFKNGYPVAIKIDEKKDFVQKNIVKIFEELNDIGLKYRIGIYDYPEHRPIGINAREIHIGPAIDILIKAHNWLRSYVLNRKINIAYDHLSKVWSDLVLQQNRYLSKEREKIDQSLRVASLDITGDVDIVIEQGLIVNIYSSDAGKYIENKIEAAGREFVEHYVCSDADDFTKNIIAVCRKNLRQ